MELTGKILQIGTTKEFGTKETPFLSYLWSHSESLQFFASIA